MVNTERKRHGRDKKKGGGFKEDCRALSLVEPNIRYTLSSVEKW